MSNYRDTLQPELDAVSWDSTAFSPAIHAVLLDACVPGQPAELEGLVAALNAHAYECRGAGPAGSVFARLVAAKVLVATVAIGSFGGVALAASAGDLPAPLQAVAHAAVPAVPAAPSKGSTQTGAQGQGDSPAPVAVAPAPRVAPRHARLPSLTGLCHAYTAGVKDAAGKALDNPAFTVLVTAAGGKDSVAGYCAALPARPAGPASKPAAHPTGKPVAPGHPSHPGKPAGPAAGKPAGPAVGKAQAHPATQPEANAASRAHLTTQPAGPISSEPAAHPTARAAHPTHKPSTADRPTGQPNSAGRVPS